MRDVVSEEEINMMILSYSDGDHNGSVPAILRETPLLSPPTTSTTCRWRNVHTQTCPVALPANTRARGTAVSDVVRRVSTTSVQGAIFDDRAQ